MATVAGTQPACQCRERCHVDRYCQIDTGYIAMAEGSEGRYNGLVEQLYESSVDHTKWHDALQRLINFVGCSGTHLAFVDPSSGLINPDIYVDMPAEMLSKYNGEVVKKCPRITSARRFPVGTLCYDYQHIDEREIARNEYYHWLGKSGDNIQYYLAAQLQTVDGTEAWSSLAFRAHEGHAQTKHFERFKKVLPHINRAVRLSQKIGHLRLSDALDLQPLETLNVAVLIVNKKGKLVHTNNPGNELLAAGALLECNSGNIRFKAPGANLQYQRALNNSINGQYDATDAADNSFNIIGSNNRLRYQVSVSAFKLPGVIFQNAETGAIILIETPGGGATGRSNKLARFSLTAAEGEVAQLLAEGKSVSEVSTIRQRSPHTIKSQVKSILQKTNTRRQSELVHLLLSDC
jgi:DNA-binding CsgD family transcriptional regulator